MKPIEDNKNETGRETLKLIDENVNKRMKLFDLNVKYVNTDRISVSEKEGLLRT